MCLSLAKEFSQAAEFFENALHTLFALASWRKETARWRKLSVVQPGPCLHKDRAEFSISKAAEFLAAAQHLAGGTCTGADWGGAEEGINQGKDVDSRREGGSTSPFIVPFYAAIHN